MFNNLAPICIIMIEIKEMFSLYEKEKKENKIQKLPEKFFERLYDELKKIENQIENLNKDSIEYQELYKRLENFKNIIRELRILRVKKILDLSYIEIKNDIKIINKNELADDFEIIFYNFIQSFLKSLNESIKKLDLSTINSIISIEKHKEEREKSKISVIIKKEIKSKIVGPNNKLFGPLNINDILIVDKDFAERLVKAELAEKIL